MNPILKEVDILRQVVRENAGSIENINERLNRIEAAIREAA